jgi:HK97 gp10 family phage protein
MTEIQSKGADRLIRELKGYPEKATDIFGKAVNRAAEKLRDFTKTMPPVSVARTGYDAKGIPVASGRMRQSVQKLNVSLLAAGVTARTKYAPFVHDGTGKMKARPFFDWALELGALEQIDKIFNDAASRLP